MGRGNLLALILIVLGVLGLAYGGYKYTWPGATTTIGSVNLSVNETHSVKIPVGVSIGSLVVGVVLLLNRSRGT